MNVEYLRVGIAVGVHGLNGRFKLKLTTDNLSRFDGDCDLYMKTNGDYHKVDVIRFNYQGSKPSHLEIKGVTDRNGAEALRGAEFFITKECVELSRSEMEEDRFYYYEIIGADAFIDDKPFGKVADIYDAGAGDILVIEKNGESLGMIPFVKSMVNIDRIKEGRVDLMPPEGMFEV